MALSATFKASFTDFNSAVDAAETNLKNFGDTSDRVGSTLNRMAAQFSGRQVIQQATEMAKAIEDVGGVSMLTTAELARIAPTFEAATFKLQQMGQAVPESFGAITDAAHATELSYEKLGEALEKAFTNPIGAMQDFGAIFKEQIVGILGETGAIAAGVVGGITAIGAALFELADTAAHAGANLHDMSEKTGMSVPALTNLSNAVEVAGGDMDRIGNAMFILGKNIAEDSDKFQTGLSRIGLTVEQLKAAGPDQELALIASGLAATADHSEKAAAAAEIFGGKIGRDMLPMLEKLPDALQKVADITPWTEEEAKNAEEFDQQIQSIKVHAEALGTSVGRTLLPAFQTLGQYLEDHAMQFARQVGPIDALIKGAQNLASAYSLAAAAWMVFRGQAVDMESALKQVGIETEAAAAKVAQAAKDAFDKAHSPAALLAAQRDAVAGYATSTSDLSHKVIDLNTNLGLQEAVMKTLGNQYKDVHDTSVAAANDSKKQTDALDAYNSVGADYATILATIGNEQYEGIAYDLARGKSVENLARIYGVSKAQVEAVRDSEAAYNKTLDDLNLHLVAIEGNGPPAAFALQSVDQALKSIGEHVDAQGQAWIDLNDRLNQIQGVAGPAAFKLQTLDQALQSIGEHVDLPAHLGPVTIGETIESSVTGALNKLPSDLARSFASGGGVMAEVKKLGVDISAAVMEPLMKGLSTTAKSAVAAGAGAASAMGGAFAGTAGSIAGGLAASVGGAATAAAMGTAMTATVGGAIALGAATAGIGAAAVGVVMLIEHFTKLSQTIKDGRAAEASFEQQFGGSQQMIDAVGAAYADMGKSGTEAQADIKAMFDAENQGAPATIAAIQKINDTLVASAKKTADVATGVDAITSAAQTLGGTAPAALQPLIKTLEGMPGITDDEKKSLDALLGSGTTDYAALTQTASTYGITLDQLGPKFQQADISKRADQIVKDFGDLTTAGADAGAVMDGMGKSISTLVDDAIKYGSTLPTALKPIIEHLQAAGELTDDTGKKLDDISGIKFDDTGDPLAQGIDKLTDALNNLVKVLTDAVPKAAGDAASGITKSLGGLQIPAVHVPVVVDAPGGGGGGGATPETHASGGYVGGGFPGGPTGTDTVPAWLTPGELVLTQQQQAQLGSASSGDGDIAITVPVTVDGREIARVVTHYQSRDLQARRKLSAA